MKRIFKWTILLGFALSCRSQSEKTLIPVPFKNVQVRLADGLGIVSFSIPLRYDTSFSWVKTADCGLPCATREYRFQPKKLRITEESGFIWTGEPIDSVDRFTVDLPGEIMRHKEDIKIDSSMHRFLKESVAGENFNPSKMVFDTIEQIGERPFSIFVLKDKDSIERTRVLAITLLKGNMIKFRQELLTRHFDEVSAAFRQSAINSIRSIRFKNELE